MRAVQLLLLLAVASPAVWAQTPPPVPTAAETLENRTTQRTERIQVEDGGSRVDELRVGGQTQQITVQPKAGDMPAYEVQSPDGARSRAGSRNGAETSTAPRVWNVMKF